MEIRIYVRIFLMIILAVYWIGNLLTSGKLENINTEYEMGSAMGSLGLGLFLIWLGTRDWKKKEEEEE